RGPPPPRPRRCRARLGSRRSTRLLRARARLLRAGHSLAGRALAQAPRSRHSRERRARFVASRARPAGPPPRDPFVRRRAQRPCSRRMGTSAEPATDASAEETSARGVGTMAQSAVIETPRVSAAPRAAVASIGTGDPHKYLIAFAVVLAALMQVIDSSIVNVALPDMMGNLGASLDEIAWVSTGYILA